MCSVKDFRNHAEHILAYMHVGADLHDGPHPNFCILSKEIHTNRWPLPFDLIDIPTELMTFFITINSVSNVSITQTTQSRSNWTVLSEYYDHYIINILICQI